MEEENKVKPFVKMENNKAYTIDPESGKRVKFEVDLAVYAVIKSYINLKNRDCFPSIPTIESKLGISKSTVIKSIKRLSNLGEIIVRKSGKSNRYFFPKESDNWKRINYDFLNISPEELSAQEKGLVIMLRQYFYENTNGIQLSIRGLAHKLGLPPATFNDRLQSLMKKDIIKKGEIQIKTHQTNRFSLQFNMDKLKLDLDQVNERVNKVETKIDEQAKNFEILQQQLNDSNKEIQELKKLIVEKLK